jgi:hypothetical protein
MAALYDDLSLFAFFVCLSMLVCYFFERKRFYGTSQILVFVCIRSSFVCAFIDFDAELILE